MKRFLLSIFLLLSFFATSLFAVTSELAKNDEGEASKTDPNRSFETYTSAELREYIAKLPQTETDPEVLAFEKLALNSDEYLRPLEMSLYYQGWNKDVFNQFIRGQSLLFATPTLKQMREGKGEIRNAQKAFLFALLAKNLNVESVGKEFGPFSAVVNLAYLYYEGIGTPKNDRKVREFYDSYANNVYVRIDGSSTNSTFYAYLKRYGKVGLETEVDPLEADNKKVIRQLLTYPVITWRSAYAGFMMPKDKKFAIEILTENEKFNKYPCNVNLREIYKGKYDKNDIDEVKEHQAFEKIRESRKAEEDKFLHNNAKVKSSKKFELMPALRYLPFTEPERVPNPEYSKENVKKYILNVIKHSRGRISIFRNIVYSDSQLSYELLYDVEEILPTLEESAVFPKEDLEKFLNEIREYRLIINRRKELY